MALHLAITVDKILYLVAGLLSIWLAYMIDQILRTRLAISDQGIGIKHFAEQWLSWSDVESTDVFGTGLGRFVASVDGVTLKGQQPPGKTVKVSVAYKMFSKEDQAEIKRLIDENLKRNDKGRWAVGGVPDGPLD